MTAKHTPGPWEIGQTCSYETALVAKSGITVAFAAWDGGSGCHLEIENPADARLIAAAPELLEALELAVAYLNDLPHEPSMRIATAIAKARGAA